jgi:hypothetical protein
MTPAVIRALSAKGYSTEEIAEIAECIAIEEIEIAARKREDTRQRVRAHRERKREQYQQSCNNVTRYSVTPTEIPSKINGHVTEPKTGTEIAQESLLLTDSVSKKEKKDILRKWDFDLFWKAYPRKKAKKAAEKAFRKVEREGEITLEGLLAAIRRINASAPEFIPYPASWLNAGEYLDELPVKPIAEPVETPEVLARRAQMIEEGGRILEQQERLRQRNGAF